MALSTFTVVQTAPLSSFRTFSSTQTETVLFKYKPPFLLGYPQSAVTSVLFSVLMNLPIPDIPLNGITQNLSRWFIQVVACVRTSFRFMGEQYSSCVDIPHFVHPFIC